MESIAGTRVRACVLWCPCFTLLSDKDKFVYLSTFTIRCVSVCFLSEMKIMYTHLHGSDSFSCFYARSYPNYTYRKKSNIAPIHCLRNNLFVNAYPVGPFSRLTDTKRYTSYKSPILMLYQNDWSLSYALVFWQIALKEHNFIVTTKNHSQQTMNLNRNYFTWFMIEVVWY